jgi:hypothetical protein
MVSDGDTKPAKRLQQARRAVLILARGEQPPEDMDVVPAIDLGYAETKPYTEEGGYPGLLLTPEGWEAATEWSSAN